MCNWLHEPGPGGAGGGGLGGRQGHKEPDCVCHPFQSTTRVTDNSTSPFLVQTDYSARRLRRWNLDVWKGEVTRKFTLFSLTIPEKGLNKM